MSTRQRDLPIHYNTICFIYKISCRNKMQETVWLYCVRKVYKHNYNHLNKKNKELFKSHISSNYEGPAKSFVTGFGLLQYERALGPHTLLFLLISISKFRLTISKFRHNKSKFRLNILKFRLIILKFRHKISWIEFTPGNLVRGSRWLYTQNLYASFRSWLTRHPNVNKRIHSPDSLIFK